MSPSPSICLTDSFVSLCLPLFGPGCLPAWTPVTALWGGGVHCLPLSPFICLPLSPSLDAWHGSLGGRVHLSPFVSLHLSPVASQPGCLARLSGWTGSFVSLCLPSCVWLSGLCFPSFVSRCLPAWMSGTALQADRFTCLPLSPFICLPLSPSLARLFGWTVSLVSLCLPSFGSPCLPAWMSVTALQADGFTCLPWFPFICLPSLWLDGLICLPLSPFICLPLSPSLDASLGGFICLPLSPFVCLPLSPSLDAPLGGRIHFSPVVSHPGCVALTLRGFLHFPRFCPFGGVWFAFGFGPGFGHSLSCGCWGQGPLSALHLDFYFAWARGGSSSLSIVGYTLSVRSVPRYQLRPLSVLARIWSPELTRAVRCGARLQLREGSVNPPVKQT